MNESTEQNDAVLDDLTERLRESFSDEEYRNAYAESFVNSWVAAQIKVLRESFPMTQGELAERIGSKQPGVARLENVNYSSWKVETLRKIARALHVRLRITFEEWGTLPQEIEGFKHEALVRRRFEQDPIFSATHSAMTGLAKDAPKIGPQFDLQSGAAAQAQTDTMQACGD